MPFVTPHKRRIVPPSGIITDGLVNWWPFDEGDGTVVHDTVGGRDLSMYGMDATAWVPGLGGVGHALYFNAADAYLETPHHPALDFISELTIFVVCCPTGPTGNAGSWGGGLVTRRQTGSNTTYSLVTEYQGSPGRLTYFGSTGTGRRDISGVLTYDQWSRVATVDRVAEGESYIPDGVTTTFYADGAEIGSPRAFAPRSAQTDRALRVGQSIVGLLDRNFVGYIGEIRFYDRGLDEAEAIAITTGNG